MRWIYGVAGGLALVCLSACMTDVDLNDLRKTPKLVLNSRLAVGDTVSARVTRTWFYTEGHPNVGLPEAEVDLFVNGQWKERMRWEETDRRYGEEGCFLSSYRSTPGDRIRLEVRHAGYEESWGEVIIPDTVPLLNVQCSHRTISSPSQEVLITDYDIRFRDDPAATNYYILTLEEGHAYQVEEDSEWNYLWTGTSLDFSRDPVFDDQIKAFDKLFGYDGVSYSYGRVFTDALFDGKEYVLKASSSFYVYTWSTEYGFPTATREAANGNGTGNGTGNGRRNGTGNGGGNEDEVVNGRGKDNKDGDGNVTGDGVGNRGGNEKRDENENGSRGENEAEIENGSKKGIETERRIETEKGIEIEKRIKIGRRIVNQTEESSEETPPLLRRFCLYSLTESYYLYLRSMIALEGSTFEGDLANMGLTSPVRVYSNIGGGGTGIVAAYATATLIFPQ